MSNKSKKGKSPKPAVTHNATEAEATGAKLLFEWNEDTYEIDVANLSLGQWTWAHRKVSNENLSVPDRLNALIDMLEAALGQEQTAKLLNKSVAILEDYKVQLLFWTELIRVAQGVTPGE